MPVAGAAAGGPAEGGGDDEQRRDLPVKAPGNPAAGSEEIVLNRLPER